MTVPKKKIPKVFISYSHGTEDFADKILNFANKLRTKESIDANIDQYEESPSQGWPRWMDEEIHDSDYVLIVCTKDYITKFNNYKNYEGKGVNWEISIIYQALYDNCCNNTKFIPILFDDDSDTNIPAPLKGATYYSVENPKDFRKLCNRLKGIPNIKKPELGSNQEDIQHKDQYFTEKPRKSLLVSSFIDIDLWNHAGWSGVAYSFEPTLTKPTYMFLIYKNKEAACKIFSKWKKISNNKPFEDLDISIIKDVEGYYTFISSNIDSCIKRIKKQGLSVDESLIQITSRYQFMDQKSSINNLNIFKKSYDKVKKYYIAPAYLTNAKSEVSANNISLIPELAIEMNKVKFLNKYALKPNDIEYAVVKSPNPNR